MNLRPRLQRDHRKSSLLAIATMLTLILPGVARANDISIGVGAPASVAVGDTVEVKAIVMEGAEPVEGAGVSLTYPASLAGEDGRVELDRQTTGADGVAVLTYVQRAGDNGEMWVSYVGPEEIEVAPVVFDIEVLPGDLQQHRSEAGVSIPWLTGWIVIAVIMLVWALIVYSALQLVLVGRARIREVQTDSEPKALAGETGSTWLSVAFAVVAVVTAVGMVVVFLRNPLTHTNIDTSEGYDRTPIAHVGEVFPYLGSGLTDASLVQTGEDFTDGGIVYFQFGCAGCHGLDGGGGTVGPALVGEIGSIGGFSEDVRSGPRSMPAYAEVTLTEEQMSSIHFFLKSSEEGSN